jgi:hypothetical protein
MRWLVCLFLLVSSFAHGELLLQSGIPLAARMQHCPEHVMGNERRNLAITLSPPTGGSDLKLRMKVNLPVRKGQLIEGALVGQGGTGVYAYNIASGSLPPGVSLDGATGLLSGTPSLAGHYSFLARVQDSGLAAYRCTFSIDVLSPLYVIAASPPIGEVGLPYVYSFVIGGYTGSPSTLRWTTTSGLPDLLALTGSGTGAAPITTTTSGAITIVGTDYRVPLTSGAAYANGEWITVNDFVGTYVEGRITSGGGTGVVFLDIASSRQAGTVTSLPAGTTVEALQGSSGELHGTPGTAAGFFFTVTVTDTATGDFLDIPAHVEIVNQPTVLFDNLASPGPGGIGGSYLPPAYIGVPYRATVTVSDGVAPFTFFDNGFISAFPELTLDTKTGVVSGTITDVSLVVADYVDATLVEIGVVDSLGGGGGITQAGFVVLNPAPSADGAMAAYSDQLLPTQKSVVDYVAAHGGTTITVDGITIDETTAGVISVIKAPKLSTARSISMTGDVTWTVSFDGSGNVTAAGTIKTNVALAGSPTTTTQAAGDSSTAIATTAFVQNALTSLDAKPPVSYCSTSALPANTYANGSSGIGATLTGTSNGPLIIDGVTTLLAQAGSRVLITAESAGSHNGWYTLTQVGVVAVSPYILTRSIESDQASEIESGYLTAVQAPSGALPGTSNNGKVFISIAPTPFVVGTDTVTFASVGNTYTADGSTLQLVGTTFSEKDGGTTNAKLANMAAHTVKANITAGSAAPVDSSLSAILDAELSSTQGVVLYRGASAWSALSPGTSGQILQTNGSAANPSWVNLGSVPTGWSTVMDLDFSAQGSQTLNPDGNYTIGGIVWTKVNSTNDSTAMAVTNGSGLVITPKSTGSWSSNTRTAPAIELPLSNIISNFDTSFGLRVYLEVASENPAANTDALLFGIDNLDGTAARVYQNIVSRGFISAANNIGLYTQLSTATSNNVAGITLGSGNRTMLFEAVSLPLSKTVGTAAGGGAWPGPSSFVPSHYLQGGTQQINSTTNPVSLSAINFFVGAQRSGSGTAYVVTVKRIRVDVRK